MNVFLSDQDRTANSGSGQLQVGFAQKTLVCICSNDLQRPATSGSSAAQTM